MRIYILAPTNCIFRLETVGIIRKWLHWNFLTSFWVWLNLRPKNNFITSIHPLWANFWPIVMSNTKLSHFLDPVLNLIGEICLHATDLWQNWEYFCNSNVGIIFQHQKGVDCTIFSVFHQLLGGRAKFWGSKMKILIFLEISLFQSCNWLPRTSFLQYKTCWVILLVPKLTHKFFQNVQALCVCNCSKGCRPYEIWCCTGMDCTVNGSYQVYNEWYSDGVI